MKRIEDGIIYDTEDAKLIYPPISNCGSNFPISEDREWVYLSNNGYLFEVWQYCNGGKRQINTDQEQILNFLLEKGIDLTDKIQTKENNKMKKSNVESSLYLKERYEELKAKLEEIKKEMLEIKAKAKKELEWIMTDEAE